MTVLLSSVQSWQAGTADRSLRTVVARERKALALGWAVRLGESLAELDGEQERWLGQWFDGYGWRAACFWQHRGGRWMPKGARVSWLTGGRMTTLAAHSDVDELLTARGEVADDWIDAIVARVRGRQEATRQKARESAAAIRAGQKYKKASADHA